VQVEVGERVVAIPGLVEALAILGEPVGDRDPVAKRAQFEEGHVEATAVEAHQPRPAVATPALPETADDLVWPRPLLVEGHEVEEPIVRGHLRHHQRHGQLERVGDEILAVLDEQFFAILLDRRFRVEFLARVAEPRDEVAVGHALDVEHQARCVRFRHHRVTPDPGRETIDSRNVTGARAGASGAARRRQPCSMPPTAR
jgi:hypothetical protein